MWAGGWSTVLVPALLFLAAGAAHAQLRHEMPVVEDVVPLPSFLDGEEREGNEDGEIETVAMWLQQPPVLSTPGTPTQPTPRRGTGTRSGNIRLASVTNMFGDDCGKTTITVSLLRANGAVTNGEFMLPIVGGARTAKIAENGNSLPVDRVFFNYNHFANAIELREQQAIPPGPQLFRTEPIDRYTMGFEKTFFDGLASVELRMPFTGSLDANLQTLSVSNGNIGNLAVLLKGLLYEDEQWAIGFGLGIDTPTGSETVARLGTFNVEYENDAVHLLPYVGFNYSPGDPLWGWGTGWFVSGFLQVDVAGNGNTVVFTSPSGIPQGDLGKFSEQTVLFTDLAVGYWLYRDPDAERLTGLSVVGEIHHTTSLQDADVLAGTINGTAAAVSNPSNRFDVVNGTIGVQALLFEVSSLRVGASFPLGSREDQRFFDSEVQVQFNRRF